MMAAITAITCLLASVARADGPPALSADPWRPSTTATRTIYTADTRLPDHLAATATLAALVRPVVVVYDAGGTSAPVSSAVPLHLAGALRAGPTRVGLTLPVYLLSTSETLGAAALFAGDPSLDAAIAIREGGEGRVGVAPLARVSAPMGASARLLGEFGLSWELGVAVDGEWGGHFVAINAGTRGLPGARATDDGDQLWYCAAYAAPVGNGLHLGGELLGATSYRGGWSVPERSPLQALVVASGRLRGGAPLHAGLGTGIIGGYGSPLLRVVVGVGAAETVPY